MVMKVNQKANRFPHIYTSGYVQHGSRGAGRSAWQSIHHYSVRLDICLWSIDSELTLLRVPTSVGGTFRLDVYPNGYNNINYGFTPYNGVADLGSVAIASHPTTTSEANGNVATRIVTFTGATGDDVCGFRVSEGFRCTEVLPDREGWTPTTYIRGSKHESAEREFSRDMNAMRRRRLA
jgi:hypothetical protein